jgi:hypothetical protein
LRWRSILKSTVAAVLFAVWSVCVCAAAAGAVYKCEGEGGVPMYQEFPCASGKELRNFETDPPPLTIVPGTQINPAIITAPRETRPPAQAAPPRGAATKPDRASGKGRGDPAERRHVHVGMSEAEVLAKLGRPDVTAVGARKGRGRWSYLPAPGDADTITSLQFDRGTVVDVERKLVKR